MIARPATLQDVLHVAETMWNRGVEELSWVVSRDDWLASWARRIERGDGVAFGSHAILGWDPESPGVVTTSFQASRSFEEPGVGKQVTKALRKAIPPLMEERGVSRIHLYSLCVDPGAAKWFALLGFDEDKSYAGIKRGPYTTRRFVRSV